MQAEAYGIDTSKMDDKAFADYLRLNFLAAHTELSEALQNLEWKPYHGQQPGRPTGAERERTVVELIDVLHHVGNLFVALNVADAELEYEYERKSQRNRKRQEEARVNRADAVVTSSDPAFRLRRS